VERGDLCGGAAFELEAVVSVAAKYDGRGGVGVVR
jgi:hypothetical protein